MPVTLPAFYRDYIVQAREGTLDLSGTRCPRHPGVCRHGGPLEPSSRRVVRRLVVLQEVRYGDRVVEERVEVSALIALGRCPGCGSRCRLLPADVPPRKKYALPVIERAVGEYQRWDQGLRHVVAAFHGEPQPAHTTLHG
jgi:hypothetical protein